MTEAACIYLTGAPLEPGRDTIPAESPSGAQGDVIVDWKGGRLVGIEILRASPVLHTDPLARASNPDRG